MQSQCWSILMITRGALCPITYREYGSVGDNWGSWTNTIWMLVNLRNDHSPSRVFISFEGNGQWCWWYWWWLALIKGRTKAICLSPVLLGPDEYLPIEEVNWGPFLGILDYSFLDSHFLPFSSPMLIPGSYLANIVVIWQGKSKRTKWRAVYFISTPAAEEPSTTIHCPPVLNAGSDCKWTGAANLGH